jgi:chemotaxis protein MotB
MSRRHKKKHHEEEENQERWLLTYADMITLLVAFFMMMYSMSVINLEKFKAAAMGIRSGFNGPIINEKKSGDSMINQGTKTVPLAQVNILDPLKKPRTDKGTKEDTGLGMGLGLIGQPGKGGGRGTASANQAMGEQAGKELTPGQLRAKRVGELTQKIATRLKTIQGIGKLVKVTPRNKGVAIELMGDLIFFPKQSAFLSDKAREILSQVAVILAEIPNEVSVEGHTGKFGADNSAFESSWELSTARGTAVVKFLLKKADIHPQRVSITGYGQFRPLAEGARPNPTIPPDQQLDRVRVFIYQQ